MGPAYLGYCLLGIGTVSVIAAAAAVAGLPVNGGWLECVLVASITGVLGFGLIAIERSSKRRDRMR